jgi:hypothetical protein
MRARLAAVLAVLVAFLAGSFVVRHPSSLLAYPDRVRVWLRVWEWGVLWRVLQCRLRGGVGVMPFQHEQWANLEPLGEESSTPLPTTRRLMSTSARRNGRSPFGYAVESSRSAPSTSDGPGRTAGGGAPTSRR